jgi:O-antigen ligase
MDPHSYSTSTVPWWAHRPDPRLQRSEKHGGGENVAAFSAVVIFTLILLLSPQTSFPVLAKLRIAFVAAGSAALFLLWDRWARRDRLFNLQPEVGVAVALLAWAMLMVPLSLWPGGSVNVMTDPYLKAVIVFWLLANVITTPQRLRWLAITLMICVVPLSTTAVKNYVTGSFLTAGGPSSGRIQGYQAALASNPNDLALMLNLLIPLGIALFLSGTRVTTRVFSLGVVGCAVIGVIVTFSRAGFLGLATIAVIYFARLVRRPGDRRWAFAVLVLVIFSLPFLPSTYVRRISTITDIDADTTGSSQERWRDTVAAARYVMEHPIIGAGIGMDTLALNQVRGARWRQVHNVYLEYAVDLGLPGLSLFLLLQWGVFRTVRSARKRSASVPALRELHYLAEGLEVSLIVFAVAGCFHPVAYHFYFYYMAGMALGARAATEFALAANNQPANATAMKAPLGASPVTIS